MMISFNNLREVRGNDRDRCGARVTKVMSVPVAIASIPQYLYVDYKKALGAKR